VKVISAKLVMVVFGVKQILMIN